MILLCLLFSICILLKIEFKNFNKIVLQKMLLSIYIYIINFLVFICIEDNQSCTTLFIYMYYIYICTYIKI